MRDPFRPPEDRCRIAELSQWRYQGAVRKGERWIGILKDSQQKWRRVEEGQKLENGWTIVRLTAQTLTLTTGKNCAPPQWRWLRQERTMKRWIAIILIVLMPAAQAGKAAKVTLVVDDVPVVQVLQALAEQERQNLVASPDVSGTLSLHLMDVPWRQALQTVASSAGLVLRQEGIFSMYTRRPGKKNITRARMPSG
ncbi:DNA utilization protein HofP [Salmonella enterica subsp. arizonae]|uniref:DNA utilization protein HofP n=1 Tax=Salmonella enterica subsp. arizonae TaxID=59203 RepID=A0A379RXY4_SALER|nr:DNA utilization protein HofP [Salmonella enterica subsp. arizonae]